jgi:hypothetical protein
MTEELRVYQSRVKAFIRVVITPRAERGAELPHGHGFQNKNHNLEDP